MKKEQLIDLIKEEISKINESKKGESKKNKLQKKLWDLVYKIEDIVKKEMPDKGLKETDSQKVYLLNKLRSFEFAVNGIKDEDFEAEDED